jgi:hypothetical protein
MTQKIGGPSQKMILKNVTEFWEEENKNNWKR